MRLQSTADNNIFDQSGKADTDKVEKMAHKPQKYLFSVIHQFLG